MNRDEIISLLKTSYDFLSSEYSVSRIAIFGSVARDTMTPDSDVDLLVEFSSPIGFRLNQLAEYLEELLGRKVDLITKDGVENIRVKEVARSIQESLRYV
jgi:uncharacterized protein